MKKAELLKIVNSYKWDYLLKDNITQTRIGYVLWSAERIPEIEELSRNYLTENVQVEELAWFPGEEHIYHVCPPQNWMHSWGVKKEGEIAE